jgi:hypothetical protein
MRTFTQHHSCDREQQQSTRADACDDVDENAPSMI